MKNSVLTVLLSLFCGFIGGGLSSMRPWSSQKVLRAESLELTDSQGINVYLGPTKRGSALQFLDHEHQLRAQIAADDQSSQIDLRKEQYESVLAVSSLPGFSIKENNIARLGFGLQSDDIGSTSQQQWEFYSGGTGLDLRAVFGSGIPYGVKDRQIRGYLGVCCNKDGNFWEAPPANDTYNWSRVKK